jgi:hypothetical protein
MPLLMEALSASSSPVSRGVAEDAYAEAGHRRFARPTGHPVDTGHDGLGAAHAVTVEGPDGDQIDGLGHAEVGAPMMPATCVPCPSQSPASFSLSTKSYTESSPPAKLRVQDIDT